MTIERDKLLITLSAILDFGNIEAARLILAEAQMRPLGDPDAEPLHWMDDKDFEDLQKRVEAEAFRRERVRHPHTGDRWCRRVTRIVPGDILCLPIDGDSPPTPGDSQQREVSRILPVTPEDVLFEFTDGKRLSYRLGDLVVVLKKQRKADHEAAANKPSRDS